VLFVCFVGSVPNLCSARFAILDPPSSILGLFLVGLCRAVSPC
jgi:hypothetical protein